MAVAATQQVFRTFLPGVEQVVSASLEHLFGRQNDRVHPATAFDGRPMRQTNEHMTVMVEAVSVEAKVALWPFHAGKSRNWPQRALDKDSPLEQGVSEVPSRDLRHAVAMLTASDSLVRVDSASNGNLVLENDHFRVMVAVRSGGRGGNGAAP